MPDNDDREQRIRTRAFYIWQMRAVPTVGQKSIGTWQPNWLR